MLPTGRVVPGLQLQFHFVLEVRIKSGPKKRLKACPMDGTASWSNRRNVWSRSVAERSTSIGFHNPIRFSVHKEKVKKRIKRIAKPDQNHLSGLRTLDCAHRRAGLLAARQQFGMYCRLESVEAGWQFSDSGKNFSDAANLGTTSDSWSAFTK